MYPSAQPWSFTDVPDFVFDQVLTFATLNIMLNDLRDIGSSFEIEHNLPDGIHTNIRQASGNSGDVPAPSPYGGEHVKFEKMLQYPTYTGTGSQLNTVVTLDDSIDYRDRVVHLKILAVEADSAANGARWLPGGASDGDLWQSTVRDIAAGTVIDYGGVEADLNGGGGTLVQGKMVDEIGYTKGGNGDVNQLTDTAQLNARLFVTIAGGVGAALFEAYIYISSTDGSLKLRLWTDNIAASGNLDNYQVVVHGFIVAFSDEGHI